MNYKNKWTYEDMLNAVSDQPLTRAELAKALKTWTTKPREGDDMTGSVPNAVFYNRIRRAIDVGHFRVIGNPRSMSSTLSLTAAGRKWLGADEDEPKPRVKKDNTEGTKQVALGEPLTVIGLRMVGDDVYVEFDNGLTMKEV